MKIRTQSIVQTLCVLTLCVASYQVAHSDELNTVLMNSTFEIGGPSTTVGKTTTGTVFFMLKPQKDNPQRAYFVLITAAHVLNEIAGEDATLLIRAKNNKEFRKTPFPLKIRRGDKNFYVTNPTADVAAMYVSLPSDLNTQFLPIQALADDAELERIEIHPGDELFCLGFPLRADFNGFPVLRTGTLASYPITPSKTVKQYMFTFHIFPGNSGGPVYYSFTHRFHGGAFQMGEIDQGVIGLVTQQLSSSLPEYKDSPLDVAVVVPSSYIRDTIALLPEAP